MNDREQTPTTMNERPQRKTPVHLPVRGSFNKTVMVFLTVCAEKKKPILALTDIHLLLTSIWLQSDHWRVGRYVIMPDHIHLFCSPGRLDCLPLTRWVQFWKAAASRQWPRRDEQPVWQKSCWDTQLRTRASYSEKWDYVWRNPVRAGLCPFPDDWPFKGEMNSLFWRD
jgi:putative transposase